MTEWIATEKQLPPRGAHVHFRPYNRAWGVLRGTFVRANGFDEFVSGDACEVHLPTRFVEEWLPAPNGGGGE